MPLPTNPGPCLSDVPSGNLDADRATARRVLDVVARYDAMRVRIYQDRPGNPERIVIREFGSATALRFPAVGYFNEVYHFREEDFASLDAITAFYGEQGLDFKLHVATDTRRDAVFARLAASGFHAEEKLARLFLRDLEIDAAEETQDVEFTAISRGEREKYFRIYLDCFGADPAKHDAALRNMMLLHDEPSLHCMFARVEGEIAGIGMLFVDGKTALLCAGATLPKFRRSGCQTALIQRRVALARELGCDFVASWTDHGSRSHENLVASGFAPAYVDPVWHLRGCGQR